VTIAANSNPSIPSNLLTHLQFTATDNATVNVGTLTGQSGSFPVPVAPPAAQVSFVVQRVTPGQAATVHLVVTDGCGTWPTFVGGGPTAF
jgi:hypothetical protein